MHDSPSLWFSSHFIFIFYLFDVFLILFKSSYFCYFSFFIAYNTVLDSLYCNLKKVLALVLAFACAFTMFAGAAFTGSADIKVDTEVVDTLVSLGVVNGYDDGSFKPNGTVTRAEMAKMIYVLRTGNSDASAYNDDKTSFTDIGSHWARGYIKYCQSLGIIAGKSNTKFCPNDKVTAQEAAKMLLVTLGYDATKAGLTGAGWASKTNALADENGLLEDVTTSFTAACPRQYAAQLIYNAIFAHTVVLRDGEYTNMKLVTSAGAGADNYNPTIGKKYMGLEEAIGELNNISYDEDKDEFTYTVAGYSKPILKSSKDYSNLYGLNVDVLYKTTSNKTTVYGIYAKDSSIVASGVLGDLEIVKNDAKKIKIDGTEYKLTDATSDVLMVETISGTAFKKADTKSKKYDNKLVDGTDLNPVIADAAQAYKFDLLDTTDDDKGDKIIVHPVTVAKVSYAGTKSITAGDNYTFEKHDIADGIKKDDYVVITPADNTAKHRANIVKAEVVTGKINGKKSSDDKVSDTWYTSVIGTDDVNNGDTCDVVVYNGYAFNFDVTAESSKDILYVSAVGKYSAMTGESDGTVKVRAYFTDGTNKEIKVRKVDGKKVNDAATDTDKVTAIADTLYTYKSTDDGYELTPVRNASQSPATAKNLAGYDSLVSGKTNEVYNSKKFNTSTDKYAIADDAVVFVKNGYTAATGTFNEVKVLSGKAVNNWGTLSTAWGVNGKALIDEVNGISYVKVAYIVGSGNRPTASDDTQYGYLLEDAYTTTQGADDDKVIAYHIWTGSEDTTVYEEIGGNVATDKLLEKGAVIRYEVDGDYVTAISGKNSIFTDTAKLVAITGIEYKSKGTVAYRYMDNAVAKNTSLDMDEDCVYIAVDDKNTVKYEGGLKDIATAKSESKDMKTANAWIFTTGAGANEKITAIVFDVPNNEINADNNEF